VCLHLSSGGYRTIALQFSDNGFIGNFVWGNCARGIHQLWSWGCGMAYGFSPTASGWQPVILYSFLSGARPGLVKAGSLYGPHDMAAFPGETCINGGCGTVFSLTPSQGAGSIRFSTCFGA
jgi:hypothetical protein